MSEDDEEVFREEDDEDGEFIVEAHDDDDDDENDNDDEDERRFILDYVAAFVRQAGGFERRRQQDAPDRAALEARAQERGAAFRASGEFGAVRSVARDDRLAVHNVFGAVAHREATGVAARGVDVLSNLLPGGESGVVGRLRHQLFSAKFSPDGSLFAASCQDARIRLYDTATWRVTKTVAARHVSWAVLDSDYSPDQRWLAYCSWSQNVMLVNTRGAVETHSEVDLRPPTRGRFCLFSLRFSPDSTEVVGGSCDAGVYLVDLLSDRRERLEGHTDDVNAVCYMRDGRGQTIVSGSDDNVVRVWDKRSLECVGSFTGHMAGITSVDSRDDFYLLSNSKDQSAKLWDLRKMGAAQPEQNAAAAHRFVPLDYRLGAAARDLLGRQLHDMDTSLVTYRGHQVLQTLCRAYFAPPSMEGCFVYGGSFDGSIKIWDTLTGDIVSSLDGHRSITRDVSWNPTAPQLASVSWDGTTRVWNPKGRPVQTVENADEEQMAESSSDQEE